jgi:hypothetical protein
MRSNEPEWHLRIEASLYKIILIRFLTYGWYGWAFGFALWYGLYPVHWFRMWKNGTLMHISDRREVFIRKSMGGVWAG